METEPIAWKDYRHHAERTVERKVYLSLKNHREVAELTGWGAENLSNYYFDARARGRSVTITLTTTCVLQEDRWKTF